MQFLTFTDAKSKLQDLQTLHIEKMTHSENSPTKVTSLAVIAGYLSDDIVYEQKKP